MEVSQKKLTVFYVSSAWIMAIMERLGFSVDIDGNVVPLLLMAVVQLLCVAAFAWSLAKAFRAAYRGNGFITFLWPSAGALAVLGAVALV